MPSSKQLVPFTLLQSSCFTARTCAGWLNPTGKRPSHLVARNGKIPFADLFSVYVYDGKVVISLKNWRKREKADKEIPKFPYELPQLCLREVVAFLHKHPDIEC